MKKILYIDPISHIEHSMFNSIYINDISKDNSVHLIMREGATAHLQLNFEIQTSHIPNKLYRNFPNYGGLLNRLLLLRVLLYIKIKYNFDNYDYVIFSCYEEFSFYFSYIKRKCYLINHNNLHSVKNKVKLHILQSINKRHRLIVLHDNFRDLLLNYNIKSLVIKHGLPEKISLDEAGGELRYRIDFNKYKSVVFSPSKGSIDKKLLEKLVNDSIFNEFLKVNKILFVIKGSLISKLSNILVIDYFLSKEDYDYIFYHSEIIFIGYGKEFQNRISGVYIEAIANQKKILLSDFLRDSVYYTDTTTYFFYNYEGITTGIKTLTDARVMHESNMINSLKPNVINVIKENER